jgi:hypothetical protein
MPLPNFIPALATLQVGLSREWRKHTMNRNQHYKKQMENINTRKKRPSKYDGVWWVPNVTNNLIICNPLMYHSMFFKEIVFCWHRMEYGFSRGHHFSLAVTEKRVSRNLSCLIALCSVSLMYGALCLPCSSAPLLQLHFLSSFVSTKSPHRGIFTHCHNDHPPSSVLL